MATERLKTLGDHLAAIMGFNQLMSLVESLTGVSHSPEVWLPREKWECPRARGMRLSSSCPSGEVSIGCANPFLEGPR